MKVAVLDVDGTLYPGALGLQLLRTMLWSGTCDDRKVEAVFSILKRYSLREIDHATMAALAYRAYAEAIAGMLTGDLEKFAEQTWEEEKLKFFPFVGELVELFRRRQFIIVLISGSPEEIIRKVATELGVADFWGAVFAAQDGRYTGEILRRPGALGAKSQILSEFALRRGIDFSASVAMGDSLADLAVLEKVGKPIVFEPQAEMLVLARENQWTIASRHDIMERISDLLGA